MKLNLHIKIFALFLFVAATILATDARAQVESSELPQSVNYGSQPVVDRDLDGLTDEGEKQIYKTDPNKTDSDDDKLDDGVEVLSGSDPLDGSVIPGSDSLTKAQNIANAINIETPWPWYISRVSALLGFFLMYASIFLVLTIRISWLRKIFAPALALNAHGWLALQATILAFVHGTILIFDKFIGMSLKGVLIPFASSYEPLFVGLGTVAFYLMVLLVATSYARKYMSFKIWRAIHFLNIVLYFSSIAHAMYLGTDLQGGILRDIFIFANILLIVMMFFNMFVKIRQNIAAKKAAVSSNPNS